MGHPLFRQLTTRYTTAMDTKMPKPEMPKETPEERERLLSRYSARDRWLIEDVLKAHPTLTAAEAIEHLEAQGSRDRNLNRGDWWRTVKCVNCVVSFL